MIFKDLSSIPDNSACVSYLIQKRWGSDIICPYCGRHHCKADGSRFRCPECHRKFSVYVGTIFEGTKIQLRKWFIAIWLMANSKKGISSLQLSRDIGVTQKTAYYMLMRIRVLFAQKQTRESGIFELDEVYIGGKERWKHFSRRIKKTQGRSTKTKTPVFGILKRGGSVKAFVVEKTDRATLLPIIYNNIRRGSHIYTDELSAYTPLSSMYEHEIVTHKTGTYVSGSATTNSIEGFWSHLRRMINIHHSVSQHHLQAYVDEHTFRWNTRRMTDRKRFALILSRSYSI